MLSDGHIADVIPIPNGKLTYITFDKLLATLSDVDPQRSQGIVIDCRELEFVDPFGMIGLLLLCRAYRACRDACYTYLLPEGKVRSYLGRAGFVREALKFASFVPSVDDEWLESMDLYLGGTSSLLEVTPLEEIDAIPSVLKCVEIALCHQLAYCKTDAWDICIVLSEICHNVFDHNDTGIICYVAMQTYTNRQGHKFILVSVGDDGLGIPNTLRRNPEYANLTNDSDAILKSFGNRVSEYSDPMRGNGLYHLLELVLKHKGTLNVRSAMGKVYVRGDRRWGRVFDVAQLGGTQFAISFPTR